MVGHFFDYQTLILILHPIDPVIQVDEVVTHVSVFGDFLNDFVNFPNFTAFAAHDGKFVDGYAEEKNTKDYW